MGDKDRRWRGEGGEEGEIDAYQLLLPPLLSFDVPGVRAEYPEPGIGPSTEC